METLDDRLVIRTPEAVDTEVTLAGLASRGIAALVDQLLKLLILIPFIGLAAVGPVGTALFIVALFAINYGYDVFFEVRRSGRTPGKRGAGIRVMSLSGGPVTLRMSALRGILRIVDEVTFGLSAAVAILVSSKNQRLGDMAAGTIVLREEFGDMGKRRRSFRLDRARRGAEAAPGPQAVHRGLLSPYQVSAVTQDELSLLRRFLERRHDLPHAARQELAASLAGRVRGRVPGATDLGDERLIEEIVGARMASV